MVKHLSTIIEKSSLFHDAIIVQYFDNCIIGNVIMLIAELIYAILSIIFSSVQGLFCYDLAERIILLLLYVVRYAESDFLNI